MSNLPVIAAIPNYNMADELVILLPQLIGQGYKNIFVLDDNSTDNSRGVVKEFGRNVILVPGDKNLGAGGNRNRIIDILNYDALIHFIDADTRIETKNMPSVIQSCVPDEDFAFIGGLAKTTRGIQNVWNYGPRPGIRNEIGANKQYKFGELLNHKPDQAKAYHDRHRALLKDWLDPLEAPKTIETFWCIEQNIVFRSDIFKRYSGFDYSIRENEILELSHRMHSDGLKAIFNPSFVITHTEGNVRQYNRAMRKRLESIKLLFQYGVIGWLKS